MNTAPISASATHSATTSGSSSSPRPRTSSDPSRRRSGNAISDQGPPRRQDRDRRGGPGQGCRRTRVDKAAAREGHHQWLHLSQRDRADGRGLHARHKRGGPQQSRRGRRRHGRRRSRARHAAARSRCATGAREGTGQRCEGEEILRKPVVQRQDPSGRTDRKREDDRNTRTKRSESDEGTPDRKDLGSLLHIHGELTAEPPEGLVELAARINACNDSSAPRRSSLPTSTPTMRPRHPGGRRKSQLSRTSVPPSLVSVSVTCSWLVTPNGRWTIKSAHRCCGSTSRTPILTGHSRPKPRAARSITCPPFIGPAGTAGTNRPCRHSPIPSTVVRTLHIRSGDAALTAAGQTLTITRRA